jgi:AraC family transcriptional regulator, transcriptional activator of pobA
MEKISHYTTITALAEASNFALPLHPSFTLLTCSELLQCSIGHGKFTGDFYMIALKRIKEGNVLYGKTIYDHSNGCMAFLKPRQIIEISGIEVSEKAFVVLIHEDFLNGHHLRDEIDKYGYFEYEVNEALHLSPAEEKIMWELFEKMSIEMNGNQDEMTRDIVLSHIEAILKYSDRYYKRQFANRSQHSGATVTKFQDVLTRYFNKGLHITQGLPSVHYLAGELFLSTRYLSDLLKQETGKTALEHIHIYLVQEAKNQLLGSDVNISEIAYDLGFESPSYFTRLFKKEVGRTPAQYRNQQ